MIGKAGGYNHLLRSLNSSLSQPIQLKVVGSLPKWLRGTLFRNGPGQFVYDKMSYFHLFDGHACINRFQIRDQQVTFFNRLLDTQCRQLTRSHSRLYPVFGTADRHSTLLERLKMLFVFPSTNDNVNVNVITFANEQLFALTETNLLCRLDPHTLEIVETMDIVRRLPFHNATMLAHPQLEPDGSWINAGMNVRNKWRPSYNFFRFNNRNASSNKNLFDSVDLIASLPSSHRFKLSYFHSFGLTKHYIVFIEQSLLFSFKNVLKAALFNRPISSAIVRDPSIKTRIHLIEKSSGRLVDQKFSSTPICFFHVINCFEKERQVIIDICAYGANDLQIDKFTYKQMFRAESFGSSHVKSTPVRYTLSLDKNGSTKSEQLVEPIYLNRDVSLEMPMIDYANCNGQEYNYVYGLNIYESPIAVVKLNVSNPSCYLQRRYSCDEGNKELPSEPIFVAKPNHCRTSEDDGVLLVQVIGDQRDYLSILDARTLEELARAEFPSDVKASFSFHGFFTDIF